MTQVKGQDAYWKAIRNPEHARSKNGELYAIPVRVKIKVRVFMDNLIPKNLGDVVEASLDYSHDKNEYPISTGEFIFDEDGPNETLVAWQTLDNEIIPVSGFELIEILIESEGAKEV